MILTLYGAFCDVPNCGALCGNTGRHTAEAREAAEALGWTRRAITGVERSLDLCPQHTPLTDRDILDRIKATNHKAAMKLGRKP